MHPLLPCARRAPVTAHRLGTPQGRSVFRNGARMNEGGGATVNGDIIPRFAIADMSQAPGSHPIHGLTTLGAALAFPTQLSERFMARGAAGAGVGHRRSGR